jgi:hypothetical protein
MRFRLLFVFITCLFFSSCLEINEETSIKENGSGQFSTTMDMAQLVDMMQAMGGEEFEKRKDEKIDSSFSLAGLIDTAARLTAAEKKIFRTGTGSIKMDMKKKVFMLSLAFTFSSMKELQELNRGLASGKIGFGGMTATALGEKKEKDADSQSGSEIDQLLSVFDYTIENGLIKRSINKENYQKLLNNPKMAEMKQAEEMGIAVMYKTVYKLPRMAKTVDNVKTELTDGDKTITLKQNLLKIFSTPEVFALKVTY